MKRIAIFQSDLRVGGIQKALINILNEIDYSKTEVDLYLYDQQCFFDMPSYENLHVTRLPPLFASFDRLMYFGLVCALAKDVTGGREYDVAIDFNSYRNECAVGAIKAKARKRIMWIHNDMEIKLQNEPKYRILWHFFKGKLPRYDAFAAVSPGIIEGFRRVSGLRDKPITAVPNHIDTAEIFRKKDAPVDFSVDPGKLNLCTVGRICHQKGFDLLMGYLAQVKQRRQDFHLYLIGDGPERAALETLAHDLDVYEEVVFLGGRPNPFCYMARMDGFVSTSRYEGQPLNLMEAMAVGLPLYCSKNLEKYTEGLRGYEDLTSALVSAQKQEKHPHDLAAYNRRILEGLAALAGDGGTSDQAV